MVHKDHQSFWPSPVWVLISSNLLLFIATLINSDLRYLLGLNPGDFPVRLWTIVTSMFVHGGFGHFIANMLTLYFFGRYLSQLMGNKRLLLVYFGGGLLGGIFVILLASPYSITVGASGAVFALGGALTVLMPRLKVFIFPIPVPIPIWIAVIGGFLVLSLLFGSFISWQAHLGGLIFGLIMGYFFRRNRSYYY